MKLDKIKFAKLVSFISRMTNGCEFGTDELVELDNLIDFDVPTTVPAEFVNQLHYLMSLMQEGTKKIEAIKVHRSLTGYGLKESKDMVEKYWPNNIVYEYSLTPSEVKAVTVFISEMRIKENG